MKSFTCKQCERAFSTKRGMKIHVGHVHLGAFGTEEAPPAEVKLDEPASTTTVWVQKNDLPAQELLDIARFLENLSPTKLLRVFAAILREVQ